MSSSTLDDNNLSTLVHIYKSSAPATALTRGAALEGWLTGRRSSGFFHSDDQALSEAGQGVLQSADPGGVAPVEQAPNLALVHDGGYRKGAVGQPPLAQGLVKGRLGG